jgi:hypothetical protein
MRNFADKRFSLLDILTCLSHRHYSTRLEQGHFQTFPRYPSDITIFAVEPGIYQIPRSSDHCTLDSYSLLPAQWPQGSVLPHAT